MIVDVNVLLYAVHTQAPHHEASRSWLETALNGDSRVGLPWATQLSFLRIGTHPRVMMSPMTADEAWEYLDYWLTHPLVWTATETPHHLRILRELTSTHNLTGNQIPDAHLAALALGHGVPIVSCDTDFARFTEITWINPLAL